MTRRRNVRKAADGISGINGFPTDEAGIDPGPSAVRPIAIVIERFALLILLALIPLRTLMAETHSFEVLRLFRHMPAPQGAQPATTLFIVGLIAAVAVLVGCARLFFGGSRYRWTGAELGGALLLLAGVVSTSRAGQKHLAMIGTLDFLGLVLYLLVLRQLLRRRWHIRLVLTVILATAAMVVTKCGYQHWVEIPQTIRYYESHQAELIDQSAASQDRSQASGLQYDYEKRLRSGTVTGYYGHPNILASHLILFIMTALAVVTARRKERRDPWTFAAPIILTLAGVVVLIATRSKGAMVACTLAMLLWGMWRIVGRAVSHRPRRVVLGVCLAGLLGASGFAAVLQARPGIFGRSMLFRSMYWQGASAMIADRGLMGVGADNFGRHFTQYKPVACPEEVESPHSWVVQFAAEWGLAGLAGILLLLLGVSVQLAGHGSSLQESYDRRGVTDELHRLTAESTGGILPGSIIGWMAGFSLVVFGWWTILHGNTDPSYLAMTLLVAAAPWIFFFVAAAVIDTQSTCFADDSLGPLGAVLCAGLIGFLLHTGIDLALFAGGPATTFFALIAVVLAAQQPRRTMETHSMRMRRSRQVWAAALAICGVFGLAAYTATIVRPAAVLADGLREARLLKEPIDWDLYTASAAYQAYRRVIAADAYDGTALTELIEELIPRVRSVEHVDIIMPLVHELQQRDPDNAIAYNHICALYRQRYELEHNVPDFRHSIAAYEKFVAAYPTSPNRHIYLANLLEEYASITRDSAVRVEAAHHLQTALQLDSHRIYVSQPNRLTSRQVAQIQARIRRLNHQ